jgi:multidrug efflux pump subunit AcrB
VPAPSLPNLTLNSCDIQDAYIAIFPPPPVQGLGTIGGFRCRSRTAPTWVTTRCTCDAKPHQQGPSATRTEPNVVQQLIRSMCRRLRRTSTAKKPKSQQVSLQDIFGTLQIYLGSLYVNDFNRFRPHLSGGGAGRAASSAWTPEDIGKLRVRNDRGDMVPISSPGQCERQLQVLTVCSITTVSLGGDQRRPQRRESAPARPKPPWPNSPRDAAAGIKFEWTDLTYQQILAGNTAYVHLPALHPARLPRAGRPVRKPEPAARHHPHRADVPARAIVGVILAAATTTSSPRSA